MSNLTFHRRVTELLQANRTFATARILGVGGSAPQIPGATMIIFPDRSIEETIGGGRFEAKVILDAQTLLEKKIASEIRSYDLTRSDLGMYCAGRVEVLIEGHRPLHRLVLFGGGHVGQAIGEMAAATGTFHVTIIDDRPKFATIERHEQVHEVICTDEPWKRGIPDLGPDTFCVLVTRCHDTDKMLVKRLIGEDLAYLGMIGSRSKVRTMWDELEKVGVDRNSLNRIFAPIGLPIGGKAPGEIAISVIGEILACRDRLAGRTPADHPAGVSAEPQPTD